MQTRWHIRVGCRWLIAAAICGAVLPAASSSFAEPPGAAAHAPEAKPEIELRPSQTQAESRLKVAAGADAKPGHGETLLVSRGGKRQVVRLNADLGMQLLVMLPSGELTLVARGEATPTDQTFVADDAAALKQALAADGFSKFKMVYAAPYLYVYDSSEAFYMHTRSILESMYPGVKATLESWGLPVAAPELPLVVIIMPNRAAFEAYDNSDGHTVGADVSAYYNGLSNYVVLYEDDRLWEAAPEFALKQGAYIVAHEGVHQLLANANIQQRLARWPMWISEGLAEYFCPLRVNSRLVRTGTSELPTRTLRWTDAGMVNDLRMYALLRTNASGGDVARELVSASELGSREYALAWGLVHYLASKKPQQFRAYLADVAQIEPLDPKQKAFRGRVDPLFVKHFGDDFAAIEAGVQEHLTSKSLQARYRDPAVYQTHYVVRRSIKQGRAFQVAMLVTTSPAAVREWKASEEAKDSRAKFSTKICKTRREADYQVQKFQSQ